MRALPAPFAGLNVSSDATDQTANLLAFWRCDEAASSDSLADTTVNAINLTDSGSPAVAASLFDGAATGARTFDGAATFFSASGSADARGVFLGSGYTFECLFKPNTPGTGGTIFEYAGVAEAGETANENNLFSIELTTGLLVRVRWEHSTGTDVVNTTTVGLTDQVVNYLAVVVDDDPDNANKKRVTVWIGVPPTSSSSPLTKVATWTNLAPADTGGAPNQSFMVGASQSTSIGVNTLFLKGDLDEIRISRFARSDAAIRNSYARCFRTWNALYLSNATDFGTRTRVLVADADGTLQDLSALYGWNFVLGVRVEDDIDSPGAAATLMLSREVYEGRLGLLVEGSILNLDAGGSYDPLMQLRRRIVVEQATVPNGHTIQGWEWQPIFDGFLDGVEFASWRMEAQARDKRVALFDAFILETTDYSADAPKAVEDHLQDIVTDNADPTYGYLGGTPEVFTRASPGWALNEPIIQDPQSVSDALDDYAHSIGWDIRYRWDDDRQDYRLSLFEPDRSTTTPDYEIEAGEIRKFRRFGVDASRIRNQVTVDVYVRGFTATITSIDDSGTGNKVEITTDAAHGLVAGCRFRITGTSYYDKSSAADGFYTVESVPAVDEIVCVETPVSFPTASEAAGSLTSTDQDGNPICSSVTVKDTTSIDTYGLMPARLSLTSATFLDTIPEVVDLATAIVSDLSQPKAEVEIEVLPKPFLELGDKVYVPADGKRSDTDRTYAIVGIVHEVSRDTRKTTLRLRGSVAAGKSEVWLGKLSGYRGRPPARPTKAAGTPGTPTLTGVVGGIHMRWDSPAQRFRSMWDRSEAHLSTSSGFVPSPATQAAALRGNQATIANLTPGSTYRGVVVHRDVWGNRSETSVEAEATALFTMPIPSFRAHLAADATINNADVEDRLPFDTEGYDVHGDHAYDGGDVLSTFTAPVGGPYHFDARIEVQYTNAGPVQHDENPEIRLYKNCTTDADGTLLGRSGTVAAADVAGDQAASLSCDTWLDAGDVVVLKHRGRSGTKGYATTLRGGQTTSYWSGHLVAHVP